MAHSFVQAHAREQEAFEAFARARPARPTLLVDTYDTEAAVVRLIELAPVLARDGIAIGGVRIDSGDLAAHAKAVRGLLDAAGLREVRMIEAALDRIEEGSYGFCVRCGEPIGDERLDVVPATPFCRDCAAGRTS